MDGLGPNGLKLLALLFRRPLLNVNAVRGELEISFPTASRLVGRFEELGVLREITGQRRSRLFRYEPYLRLFDEPPSIEGAQAPTQATGSLKAESAPAPT